MLRIVVLWGDTTIIGFLCIGRQLHVSREHVAVGSEEERETIKNGKGKITL